jgi:hypothetical protein
VGLGDPEGGQQRLAVGRIPLDGACALDRAASCVPPAVVADHPIVIPQGGLTGQGQELVSHQSGLDQQDRLPRASDLDLEFDSVE